MKYKHLALLAFTVAAAGCAQQVAKKVPLAARMQECDDRIEGFRYYVSRPYFVVAERIAIRDDLQLARLCTYNVGEDVRYGLRPIVPADGKIIRADEYGVQIPDLVMPVDQVYDLSGNPVDDGTFISYVSGADASSAVKNASFAEPQPVRVDLSRSQGWGSYSENEDDTSPAEVPPFQVVCLPDFEEQMAIQHHNCLAHSKFELRFRDGWQLASTKTSLDSTEVAARALQSISKAISAASEVQKTALEQNAPGAPDKYEKPQALGDAAPLVLVSRHWYIEPGIYRLQKSWERCDGDCNTCGGDGLLADLGVATVSEVKLRLIATAQNSSGT